MQEGSLDRLEKTVEEIVRLVLALQEENACLKQEMMQQKEDLEELRKENLAKTKSIERFESDRQRIRSRVERMLRQVSALEEAAKESTL